MVFILALLLIVAAVVIVVGVKNMIAQSRTVRMRRKAQLLGLQFRAADGADILSGSPAFLLFAQGDAADVVNIMQGQIEDIDVTIFDYHYRRTVGRYTQNWRQTVIRLASRTLALPLFSILPNDVHDELAENANDPMMQERLLTAGLRFADRPVLSARFHVQSLDRRRMVELMDEQLLDYHEGREDLSTEGGANQIIFYRFNRLMPAQDVEEALRDAIDGYRRYKETQT